MSDSAIPLETKRFGRTKAKCALIGYACVLGLALLGFFLHEETTRAAAVPLHRTCQAWDERAADVLTRLAHETSDASLRQAGDVLFRLRRARRNCRSGWLNLACSDYRAIVTVRYATPGLAAASPIITCSAEMID